MSNLHEVKYSNLASIYLTARSFQNNYENIKKRLVQSIGQIEYENPLPVAATNAFFAVELYLKTICALDYWENNEKPKDNPSNLTMYSGEHNLKRLFDVIEGKSKNEIVKRFPYSITEDTLSQKLEKYQNGFIEWRYFFERNSLEGDLFFLSALLEALYSTCKFYMDYKHKPKEEWLEERPSTSVTIHQEEVYSEEQLSKLMDMSLEEVMYKERI